MEKSPDAFRTISEVADVLDTPAHVLRFWESRFPQIRPVKRAGGRRYYRPADVALLAGIKRLLHDEGMTIRGVQKILREQGVRHVAGATPVPAVDAYDILGLAEAVAQADREDAAAKVIDLSARVRTVAPGAVEQAADHGQIDDRGVASASVPSSASAVGDVFEGIEDAEIVAGEGTGAADGGPAPHGAHDGSVSHPAGAVEGDTCLADTANTATHDAATGSQIVVGWLPTRLRALPPGALDEQLAMIVPLAARLADLRNRMMPPTRPGRG